jgi:inner membrane protease ATP23
MAEAGPSTVLSDPAEQVPGPSTAFDRWRSSLGQITGLGLSEAEKEAREERKNTEKMSTDWEQCEKWKKELMEQSGLPHISG